MVETTPWGRGGGGALFYIGIPGQAALGASCVKEEEKEKSNYATQVWLRMGLCRQSNSPFLIFTSWLNGSHFPRTQETAAFLHMWI